MELTPVQQLSSATTTQLLLPWALTMSMSSHTLGPYLDFMQFLFCRFQSSDSYFNYSICCGVFAFTLPPSSPIIWKESKRDFRCPSTNTFVGGFNVTARRPPKRNNYYIWTYFCQRLPETHIFEDCMVEEERIWLEGTSTRVAVSPGRIIYRILRRWEHSTCTVIRGHSSLNLSSIIVQLLVFLVNHSQ